MAPWNPRELQRAESRSASLTSAPCTSGHPAQVPVRRAAGVCSPWSPDARVSLGAPASPARSPQRGGPPNPGPLTMAADNDGYGTVLGKQPRRLLPVTAPARRQSRRTGLPEPLPHLYDAQVSLAPSPVLGHHGQSMSLPDVSNPCVSTSGEPFQGPSTAVPTSNFCF